eukprot:jgi/Tetstr1/439826/TSEL_028237.t1
MALAHCGFLGTGFELHKDDPAAREERAKTGEPLRVRPLGVGYLAKLTAVLELRRARQALDTADFGMVSDAPLRRSLS